MSACGFASFVLIASTIAPVVADPLIVVEDRGGASALSYYQSLRLPPIGTSSYEAHASAAQASPPWPSTAHQQFSEADMLPVRSERLTPGTEPARSINISGITPIFIVGGDPQSRDWLIQRSDELRQLRAIGLVTQVENTQALGTLRRLAPELTLIPASADDVADRLSISHYPVLITSSAIQQ